MRYSYQQRTLLDILKNNEGKPVPIPALYSFITGRSFNTESYRENKRQRNYVSRLISSLRRKGFTIINHREQGYSLKPGQDTPPPLYRPEEIQIG